MEKLIKIDQVDSIIDAQHEWLKVLQSQRNRQRTPELISIKAIAGAIPPEHYGMKKADLYNWVPFNVIFDMRKALTAPIYTRGILENEIVFDPDVTDWDAMRAGITKIVDYCKKTDIPVIQGYSGGKGVHLHIFFGNFDVPEDLHAGLNKLDVDPYKAVRIALFEEIAARAGVSLESIGADTGKVNFSIYRKGSQIRTFGTTREPGKFKTLVEEVPEKQPEAGELPLIFPSNIETWEIRNTDFARVAVNALRAAIKDAEKAAEYSFIDIDFSDTEVMKFPCISRLHAAHLTNGRYYAGNSLLLMSVKCGLNKEETEAGLRDLYKTFPNMTDGEVNQYIGNTLTMYGREDLKFSCKTVKETHGKEFCDFQNCPMNKKIEEIKEEEKKEASAGAKGEAETAIESAETAEKAKTNISTAKEIIKNNFLKMDEADVEELFTYDIKEHFNFKTADIGILRKYYKSAMKEQREREQAEKHEGAEKLLKEIIDAKQIEATDGIDLKQFYRIEINKYGEEKITLFPAKIAEHLDEVNSIISYEKTLYIYESGVYINGENAVRGQAQKILKMIDPEGTDNKITETTHEIIHYLTYEHPETEYPFNTSGNIIPMENGFLKINYEDGTADLIPHTPEHRFNFKLSVAYDKDAGTEAIDDVIKNYVGTDKREAEDLNGESVTSEYDDSTLLYQIPAQALLQMIGSSTFKKAYLLQGDAHAGKSSYIELLECAFGNNNIAGVSLQDLTSNRFTFADLEGKVLNCYDDLTEIPLKEGGMFKNLTGKYVHRIERKGVQGYYANIKGVHVYTCNRAPTFSDSISTDTAFWERWEFINFTTIFEMDTGFHARTFTPENMSGFFNKVLETIIKIKHGGKLLINSDAGLVREKWESNADPLYNFIETQFNHTDEETINLDKMEFLHAFKLYCMDRDIDEKKIPKDVGVFTKRLFKYGITTKQLALENKSRKWVYSLPYSWANVNGPYYVERIGSSKKKTEQVGL